MQSGRRLTARLFAAGMFSGINIPIVYLTWSPELAHLGQLYFFEF